MSARTLLFGVVVVAAVALLLAALTPMPRDVLPSRTVNQLAGYSKARSPQHFLVICWPESPGDGSAGVGDKCPLLFDANGMFSIVIPGDVVWVCSAMNGRISLARRFPVSEVIDYDEATRRSRKRLYRGDVYLWADPAVRIRDTPASDVIPKLRFLDGLQPERIRPKPPDEWLPDPDGWFSGEEFIQIRVLTPESVEMLENAYRSRPDGIIR